MPFTFKKTELPGLIIIEVASFKDGRGFFMETYKHSDFLKAGISDNFVQDNHSSSCQNVIRGLHYQKSPYAQGKLVRCTKGEIFDVAVDIRKESKTYGKYFAIKLSEKNRKMLYIPAGFAHGFAALSDIADVHYKASAEYNKESEAGIIWNDPAINIKWPINKPIISEKDELLPLFEK